MKQMLEHRVPTALRSQIAFGRLDVDPPEHWELCRNHQVLNLPFLAFYRDGVLVGTMTGKREDAVITQDLVRLVGAR